MIHEKLNEYKKIYEDLSQNFEKVIQEKKQIQEELISKSNNESNIIEAENENKKFKKENDHLSKLSAFYNFSNNS